MAAIITKNQPGRMTRQIIQAFSSRTLDGLRKHRTGKGMGNSGITQNVIGRGFDFLSQRFGTPAGTITVGPDGSVVQRQAAGYPIATQPPITFGGNLQAGIQAPGGFAAALGGTTGIVLIGGLAVVMLFALKK